jgi:hypothetical protein
MLLSEFIAGGAVTRQTMLAAFRRPFFYQGATGETRITVDGRLEKGLFLLKVEDGAIHEIERPVTGANTGPAAASGSWVGFEGDVESLENRIVP